MSIVVTGIAVVAVGAILFHVFKFLVSAPDQAYISKLNELKNKGESKKSTAKKLKTKDIVKISDDQKPLKQKAEQKKVERHDKQSIPQGTTSTPSEDKKEKKVTITAPAPHTNKPTQDKPSTQAKSVDTHAHIESSQSSGGHKQEKTAKQENSKHDALKNVPKHDTPKHDASKEHSKSGEVKAKAPKEKKPKKEKKESVPESTANTFYIPEDDDFVDYGADYKPEIHVTKVAPQPWAKKVSQADKIKNDMAAARTQLEKERKELEDIYKKHTEELSLLRAEKTIVETQSNARVARLEKEIQALKASAGTQKREPSDLLSQKNYAPKKDTPEREKTPAPHISQIMEEQKAAKKREEEESAVAAAKKKEDEVAEPADRKGKGKSVDDHAVGELRRKIADLEAALKEAKSTSGPSPNKRIEDLESSQQELYKQASAKDEIIRYLSSSIVSAAEESKLAAPSISRDQSQEVAKLTQQVKDLNAKIQTTEAALNKAKTDADERSSKPDSAVKQNSEELKALKSSIAEEKENSSKAVQKAESDAKQAREELKALKSTLEAKENSGTKDLQNARAEIEQLKKDVASAKQNTDSGAQAAASIKDEKAKAQQEVDRLTKELATAKKSSEDSAQALKQIQDEKAKTQQEVERLAKEAQTNSQVKEEKAKLQQEVDRLTKEVSSTKQSSDSSSQAITQAKEEKAKLQQEVDRLTKEVSSTKQSSDSNSQAISQAKEEKAKLQQEVDRLTKEVSSTKQSSESNSQAISQAKEEKAKLQQEVDRFTKELAATKQSGEGATTQLKEEQKKLQQENERLRKEAADNSAKAGAGDAKLNEEIAQLKREVAVEKERTMKSLSEMVAAATDKKAALASVDEKEKKIQELTTKLSEQGGANKEAERLKKELDTLKTTTSKLEEEQKTNAAALKEKTDAAVAASAKVTELTNNLSTQKKDAEANAQKRDAESKKLQDQVTALKGKEAENVTLLARIEEEKASRADVTKRLEDVQARVKDLETPLASNNGLKFVINSGAAGSPRPTTLPAFNNQIQQPQPANNTNQQ